MALPSHVFGSRLLSVGMTGTDVRELQIRLAGFRNATVPDGTFSDRTKSCVMSFQKDYMRITPSGIVDRQTFDSTETFATAYPIFSVYGSDLKCPCSDTRCQSPPPIGTNGYGHSNSDAGDTGSDEYRFDKYYEAYHKKEYPGIHRMVLWTARSVFFYNQQYNFSKFH